MKKLAILIFSAAFVLFGGNLASAQGKYGADSAECIKYLSYYQDYYKQKNMESALPNWRKAYSLCPASASQNMLLHGAAFMRDLINQNKDNETYRAALLDTLMNIHIQRADAYPKYAAVAINNLGADVLTFANGDNDLIYRTVKGIIQRNGTETSPSLLVGLMDATVNLYKDGKMDADAVFAEYNTTSTLLDEISKVLVDEDVSKYSSAIENLLVLSNVADKDGLVRVFTPRLEAEPDSYDVAATIVKFLLIADGGTSTDLFVNAAATMHRLQPSASTAYFMFRVYISRGDIDNAIKMIDQAIDYDDLTDAQKGSYCYELAGALVTNGRTAKAYEYANKGASITPDNEIKGRCYMICGRAWGATVCQGNEIEQRAPYWVAVDFMNKAKTADPTLSKECNESIRAYSQYYPTAEDAFMYDMEAGQSYTVSCGGMSATTTIKTQK